MAGGVIGCCMNAFVFGESGGLMSAVGAVAGFVSYTWAAVRIHRRRKFRLLPNR